MRFIRKHGRVIPIHDAGEKAPQAGDSRLKRTVKGGVGGGLVGAGIGMQFMGGMQLGRHISERHTPPSLRVDLRPAKKIIAEARLDKALAKGKAGIAAHFASKSVVNLNTYRAAKVADKAMVGAARGMRAFRSVSKTGVPAIVAGNALYYAGGKILKSIKRPKKEKKQ